MSKPNGVTRKVACLLAVGTIGVSTVVVCPQASAAPSLTTQWLEVSGDYGATWEWAHGPGSRGYYYHRANESGPSGLITEKDQPLPRSLRPQGPGPLEKAVTEFQNAYQGYIPDRIQFRAVYASRKTLLEDFQRVGEGDPRPAPIWGCAEDGFTSANGKEYVDAFIGQEQKELKAKCELIATNIIKQAEGLPWSEDMEALSRLTYNNGVPIGESEKLLEEKRQEVRKALEDQPISKEWLDQATKLGRYDVETLRMRDSRLAELVKPWVGKPWSADMERSLAPMASYQEVAQVLGPAQKEFLSTEGKNYQWTPELDDALSMMNVAPGYGSQASVNDRLGYLRSKYVAGFTYRAWSPELEEQLKPLVDRGFKPARDMVQKKRNEEVASRNNPGWSLGKDEVWRQVARFDEGIASQLDHERMEFLKSKESTPWSRTLDDEVSGLAKVWQPAADFMTSKRQAALNPWRDKGWTRDMDKALAPLAEVFQPAADVLQEKRDIFITTAAGKDFAEVEDDVNYLAEEKGFAPAAELAQKRREEKGDATSPDNNGGGTTGGTEAEERPVDFDKVAAMTFEEARDLGPAERKHIVEAALKEGRSKTDFENVARIYISDVEGNILDTTGMENARKLADLGVPGAQKAYTIQAVEVAGTVLASIAVLVGVINQGWPQIQSWLRSVGVKI